VSDDALRQAYERLMRARDATRRDDAVPIEAMLALVERRGSDEERLRTLDAVMRSAEARAELEVLRAAAGAVPVVPSEHARVLRRWIPIAAAAVLVVVASLVMRAPTPSADTMRGGDANAIVLVGPDAMSAGAPRPFVWRSTAGVSRYTFELLDADGAVVHTATTRDTMLALPPAVRLVAGADYRWVVRADAESGRTLTAVPRALRVER
jgi:hypothetical protein